MLPVFWGVTGPVVNNRRSQMTVSVRSVITAYCFTNINAPKVI